MKFTHLINIVWPVDRIFLEMAFQDLQILKISRAVRGIRGSTFILAISSKLIFGWVLWHLQAHLSAAGFVPFMDGLIRDSRHPISVVWNIPHKITAFVNRQHQKQNISKANNIWEKNSKCFWLYSSVYCWEGNPNQTCFIVFRVIPSRTERRITRRESMLVLYSRQNQEELPKNH